MAWPWLSVTVRHHVVFGLAAAAAARSRASHGSTGPRPASSPGRPARPVRVTSGTVRVTRLANPAGTAPGWPAGAGGGSRGAGVLAQEQVQVGAGADLVRPAVQPGLAQLARPPGDPVTDRQHLVRRQLPARQRGVPGVLGPPLHPREPRRGLPPLPRLVRGGLHHRAGDRGAQAARGQPPGPVQHPGLGGAGLGRVEQAGGGGDDPGLAQAHGAVAQRRPVPGRWVSRCPAVPSQLIGAEPGLPQRARHLIRGELRILGPRVPPVQLGDRRRACGRRRGPRPGPTRT